MQMNFFDRAVVADPFPYYEEMHREGPVVRNELFGAWMVTAHEPVMSVLRSPALFSSVGIAQMATDRVDAFGGAPTMLFSDPPDHERLRGVVQRAFTPKAVAQLEERVHQIVDELLEPAALGEPYDAVDRLAYPLPVIVIAEMLGVSTEDRPQFREWSDALVNGINEFAGVEEQARALEASGQLREYFAREISLRRAAPGDDLVSRLVRANAEEGTLSDAELLASCVLLLVAGNETTTKFIGNAIVYLAEHPEVREQVAADPSVTMRAVEELVRLVGPAQATMRVARADTEVAGTAISEGEMVFVMLAAANRDEAVFPDPNTADVYRSPNAHIGFGHGIHFCIGAHTARLEARIAIEKLLRVAPDYRLDMPASELPYAPSYFLRGLERLPIAARSGAAVGGG